MYYGPVSNVNNKKKLKQNPAENGWAAVPWGEFDLHFKLKQYGGRTKCDPVKVIQGQPNGHEV